MNLKSLEITGIIIVALLGSALHFAYDFFDQNQFIALIAPVNESIWEHLKMAFYGMLGYGIIVYLLAKGEQPNLLFAKVSSAFIASLLVVVLYYGYTSFIDENLFMDIFIFVVSIALAQLFSLGVIKSNFFIKGINFIALLALFAGVLVFSSYTYEPPKTELFIDSNTNTYGLEK